MLPAWDVYRKWIQDLATVQIKLGPSPRNIWSLSPRETAQGRTGEWWETWQCTLCSMWAGQRCPQLQNRSRLSLAGVPVGSNPRLSVSAMISQEVQSEPTHSQYKNSSMHMLYLDTTHCDHLGGSQLLTCSWTHSLQGGALLPPGCTSKWDSQSFLSQRTQRKQKAKSQAWWTAHCSGAFMGGGPRVTVLGPHM